MTEHRQPPLANTYTIFGDDEHGYYVYDIKRRQAMQLYTRYEDAEFWIERVAHALRELSRPAPRKQ